MRLDVIATKAYLFGHGNRSFPPTNDGGHIMKTWTKPAVREQEVGLEVTSYLPAEIDVI
jgi:coenzyme PQQ precursor peptide PqqA